MPGQMSRQNGRKGGRPRGPSPQTLARRAALQRTRDLDAAAVEEQIRRGALYDVRRLFDADGRPKPITKLSEADAAMIEGFEVVKRNVTAGDDEVETVLKYKLAPRSTYVRMAGEIHGLFLERVEHSGSVEIGAQLEAARTRARARNLRQPRR